MMMIDICSLHVKDSPAHQISSTCEGSSGQETEPKDDKSESVIQRGRMLASACDWTSHSDCRLLRVSEERCSVAIKQLI